MKPRIGVVLGDPCGIGPELVAKLVADKSVRKRALIAVVGDKRIFAKGAEIARLANDIPVASKAGELSATDESPLILDLPPLDPEAFALGEVSTEAGRWQLDCLEETINLVGDGKLDGMCFAPLNKDAMHRAGLKHEDEQGFFADVLGHTGTMGLMNTVGKMWTSRVTSHVAHKRVSQLITVDSILNAVRIADQTMRQAGYKNPRLAIAGLNPHAGDGGNFGDEEIRVITPAVKAAAGEGIAVGGPYPADTIFLKIRDGEYDAVVTMYHDQGQIAMKLMGFDSGVTVHAGLPFPITTSAHGSAFDIAGKGVANVEALKQAFMIVCDMVESKSERR
ncbi:MAG: 4-hydroxythreonine-4-phosphate dehydrogenase PdxA [Rhodospirillales bacterium]|nr:4-hydroxythreonine-4-phosphate dehydrogenase PdxA [Rhodospirillales bacterium]